MVAAHVLSLLPLAVAAWTDAESRRIPDACSAAVLVLGVGHAIALGRWMEAVLGAAVIGGLFLIGAVALDSGQAIGGGDVKLCAALGALLGAIPGLIMIATSLAAMLIYGGIRRCKSAPFAPFLFPVYVIFLILEVVMC